MDTSWMNEPRSSTPFLKGLAEFLDLECNDNANYVEEIKCPCVECVDAVWVTRQKATDHISCNGIIEEYNTRRLEVNNDVAQVGTWGSQLEGSEQNQWSFRLENNHKLKKIIIDHGDLIYSLKFTTQDDSGCLHDSEKAGGWNGGNEECEVTFDYDEEIIGINGTVGVSEGEYAGYTIISSLCFITNKTTHGPFGQTTGTPFAVPWKQGSFAGFYGRAGYYIDAIGVYLKASRDIARVGLWGTEDTESFVSSQYRWSFCLEKNYMLSKITIRHSDMINCLMFTSEHVTGLVVQSNRVGGHYDESTVSEVNLGWDEEIIGVNGTFESTYGVNTIISSLSFITNERSFGPFGSETGTHFSVSWNKGSFAGFYGITANSSVDAIGVYLKPTPILTA